jgi:hypothetical protein
MTGRGNGPRRLSHRSSSTRPARSLIRDTSSTLILYLPGYLAPAGRAAPSTSWTESCIAARPEEGGAVASGGTGWVCRVVHEHTQAAPGPMVVGAPGEAVRLEGRRAIERPLPGFSAA